ncbi:hypothetical protein EC973_003174 [Apophysomyces ossiformis]|uniref:Secreted protein n=1 Tax=Apophysomyces ossiformis TaxID=679940 RepID=A0A8H7EQP7_9FUNG|nr:hypothetical protein EC973_003174 [Apophysomyces ossiformis]
MFWTLTGLFIQSLYPLLDVGHDRAIQAADVRLHVIRYLGQLLVQPLVPQNRNFLGVSVIKLAKNRFQAVLDLALQALSETRLDDGLVQGGHIGRLDHIDSNAFEHP